MKIILLGPPGAGKGTLSKELEQFDGSVQISTGDMLRAAVTAQTRLGIKIEDAMKTGNLVSDELIMDLMEERLQQDDCKNGYLLDGFPRTIPQAKALAELLDRLGEKLDFVVLLDVPRDSIIERLSTRRTCTNCGEIYNVIFKPPAVEGVCDVCGNAIVQRDDETEEAILNRLEVYQEQTEPLADYYQESGSLFTVQSSDLGETVAAVIEKVKSLN